MADPRVIALTRKAAQAAGADSAAMLATELTENGARYGLTPGDQGTSYGSFQFHRGGALGTHDPSWVLTPDAYLNRAREFARLQVHGGKGAAAIQRPADPTGYAAKVQANLAEARRLLGTAAPAAVPATGTIPKPSAPVTAFRTNDDADLGAHVNNSLQALIDASAANAGIASIQLPQIQAAPLPQAQPRAAQPQAKTMNAFGKVISNPKPKLIGFPNQGTHTLGNWESDNAVDIAIPTGTPIYAPASGIIGSQIGSLGGSSSGRFAGLRVHLKTGGNELYYAHLSRLTVKAGQRVKAGQIIGYSGSANGVQHLHLGVLKGDPRRYA